MKVKKKTRVDSLAKFLEEMEGGEQKVKIYPYHDFVGNTIYYSYFENKVGYIINSKKEFFKFTDAEKHNIELFPVKNYVSGITRTVLEKFKQGEKVNIYHCYKEIVRYLKAQVYLADETDYMILALWVMATYMPAVFDKCMYIWVNGEKGTGKTTLMECVSKISFNGLMASNIKQAALIRSIGSNGSTVFIDEKENLCSSDESDTKLALNSGFNRGAKSIKCNKENEPVEFNVYSFKMIAGINKIPDTLVDRSHIIKTKKKDKNLGVKLRREEKEDLAKAIVESLYLIGLSYADKIAEIYENPEQINIPKEINCRELDKLLPIFSIAFFIDENYDSNLVDELADAAKRKHKELHNEAILKNPEYMLAKALNEYLECSRGKKGKDDNIIIHTTKQVHSYFVEQGILEDIFSEYKYKRPSISILTKVLKKYLKIDATVHTVYNESKRCYRLYENELHEIVKKYEKQLI